ncbi:EH signature domain-containing protein [Cyanobacterium sp. DS4]|uniref:EH signature domain-containing protein n=1 Tax=Cyanobacterium sp. DS4 TaxID=2878255 RepID=UPI002E801816|nr:EH signature domain-containing protein [Cyanobacterium sp. Dongsha4]WVL00700.1 hypothetical protein Dongsha4_00435 [Cyanobacterium sp. Dongsha4]
MKLLKLFTSRLDLPPIKKIKPIELIKLTTGNSSEKLEPPTLPIEVDLNTNSLPRKIDEIMNDILHHNSENIGLLEWIYCLFSKANWDLSNSSQSSITSQLIWHTAQKNPELKNLLLWRLVVYYFNNDDKILAPSLVNTFDAHFNPQNKQDKLTVKIINLLKYPSSYQKIAELCFSHNLLPEDLLKQQLLPWNLKINGEISLVDKIKTYFSKSFSNIKNPNNQQANLLLKSLETISINHQSSLVENILNHVSPKVGIQFVELVKWLRDNYSLTSTNSRWNELSHSGKLALKKWIGAVNYKDFEQLVEVIIKRIYLEYWEINQLIKRKIFWSNYTDRFERIRILLPSSSMQMINNNIDFEEISELKADGSEDTEICIFDFEEHIIVEFFRGKGSETRIFTKTEELENLLFYSNEISIKQLRNLSIARNDIHDHQYCWQNDCESLLRSKDIFPNEGIRYFKIVEDKRGFPYDFETGMSPLYSDQIEERERKLYYWRRDIRELEAEAKKYIGTSTVVVL